LSISLSRICCIRRKTNKNGNVVEIMGAQLNSYLMSEDARSQADFYLESLGGEIVSLKSFGEVPGTPEDMKEKVMHLSLMIAGNNILMLSDSFEQVVGNRSISLALTYDNESEAREAYTKLGEGGENKYPFALQPWGAHYGEVIDKFGVTWMITKP
jgi:PhnB protein